MSSIVPPTEDSQSLAARIRAIADEVEDQGVLTREEFAREYAIVAHENRKHLDLESLLYRILDTLPIDAFHHFIGCDWDGSGPDCNRNCATLTDRLARVLTKWEAEQ